MTETGDGAVREEQVGLSVKWSGVTKVQSATEQVYEQLREVILSGEMPRGAQLPSEVALSKSFGVGRATVREALRVLASDQLIVRRPGAAGGSFVSIPTVEHVSEAFRTSLSLLSDAKDISPEDLLEVRELLEGHAVRMAAVRRSDEDVENLRRCVVDDDLIGTETQFGLNDEYHRSILRAAHNTLLAISTEPVFSVVQAKFRRKALTHSELVLVNSEHEQILQAIADGDPDAAEQAMRHHHSSLRSFYPNLWS